MLWEAIPVAVLDLLLPSQQLLILIEPSTEERELRDCGLTSTLRLSQKRVNHQTCHLRYELCPVHVTPTQILQPVYVLGLVPGWQKDKGQCLLSLYSLRSSILLLCEPYHHRSLLNLLFVRLINSSSNFKTGFGSSVAV